MNYIGMFYKVEEEDLLKTHPKNIVYESKQQTHDIPNSLEDILKNYEFENLLAFGDVVKRPITVNRLVLNQDKQSLNVSFDNFINEFYSYLFTISDSKVIENFTLYTPFVRRAFNEEGLIISYFYSIELIDGTTWFSIVEKVPRSENILKAGYTDYNDFFNRFVHNFDTQVRQSLLINHKYLNYGMSNISNVFNREQQSPIQYQYILSWYVKDMFKIDIENSKNKVWTTISNDSKLTEHNYSKKENFQVFYNKEDCALIKPISDELFFRKHFNLTLDAFFITYSIEKILELMKEPTLSLGQEQELKSFINMLQALDDNYDLIVGKKIQMYLNELSMEEKRNIKGSFKKYYSWFKVAIFVLDLIEKVKNGF